MKIIQSYWSKPYNESNNLNRTGGWSDKTFHYMSCALSCLKLSEFYPVELITDQKGMDILVNKIGLPYSDTTTELEDIDYPSSLWAMGKIITYSLQNEPFLHIDNDVFIWSKFSEHITKSNLVVQSIEENFHHNKFYLDLAIDKFNYISNSLLKQRNNKSITNSINAGIIGGNDISFIKNYAKEAIKLIESNIKNIIQLENIKGINLVFEQCLFYSLLEQQKKTVTCLLGKTNKPEYKELVEFWNIPNQKTYIHTISSYKEFYIIGEQVAQRLWYEYPEYFYRIQDLIKKNAI